jgi:phosphorylcholine metabolism protein LicD
MNYTELHPSLKGEKLKRLQEAQKTMTNMLKCFNDICVEHDINYWAIGGTLIGTVRKDKILDSGKNVGGWIPFDGDIDVAMLKTDYERFKQVSYKLPSSMFLQDCITDKKYYEKNFAKIRDKNSHYINYTPRNCHHGLQIDIFLWNKQSEFIYYKKISRDKYEEIYHNDIIFPLKKMEFEGFLINVPNKYDEYCKINFGSYPLPYLPIEKRLPHEGDVNPYSPHPQDLIDYPHFYSI